MKRQHVQRMCSGFSMAEVVLSLAIFTCMVVVFGAAVPTIIKNSQKANDFMQAHLVAQHKIEQVRGLGFTNLTLTSMQGQLLIDSPQPTGYPIYNPSGYPTGTISYSFSTIDGLQNYFPNGAVGVLTIAPDTHAPAGICYDIYSTITWSTAGGATSNFTLNTKVADI